MQTQLNGVKTCLYDAAKMEAILDRMAWQAAALIGEDKHVMIVGILRRGAPLAEMLHQKLKPHLQHAEISLMHLQIKRYADDLSLLHPETKLTENPAMNALDLSNTTVLIVDDVLFEGHSMLRAVEYLSKRQAAKVRTAVLVDRCINKLPLKADVAGVKLDIAYGDIIECNVPPYEAEFKIDLCQFK